jgi:phytoene dehydrogenase-like protein
MAPRAVVIGSGPNGLAGALTLARAGLDVEVFEAQPTLGGGARTDELTLPGFRHDVCSGIHPLGQRSPFFRLARLDVEFVFPDAPAAHPFDDGTAVVVERDVEATAAGLGADGAAYRELVQPLVEAWDEAEPLLLGSGPPRPATALAFARAVGAARAQRSIRAALASARSLAEAMFSTERGRGLFAGHAAHSMLPLERRPSAGFGLGLLVTAHVTGWGFPRGGSQSLTDALVGELEGLGGRVHAATAVDDVPAADVILADVVPRELVRLAGDRLPPRYVRALRRYRHGPGAFKLDWALSGPIPWAAQEVAGAGTVHLGGTLEEISASEWSAWTGRHSERPFVLLAQHTRFDSTRAPEGKHTAWAYCHVPNGSTVDMAERIEAQVERFAPGFRDLILARSALPPRELEARNRNLVGGDLNGGAMDLGQLFTRPVRKLVPYRTPLRGLYLCSSATPPGGGVHGMCGYAAAQVALRDLARS